MEADVKWFLFASFVLIWFAWVPLTTQLLFSALVGGFIYAWVKYFANASGSRAAVSGHNPVIYDLTEQDYEEPGSDGSTLDDMPDTLDDASPAPGDAAAGFSPQSTRSSSPPGGDCTQCGPLPQEATACHSTQTLISQAHAGVWMPVAIPISHVDTMLVVTQCGLLPSFTSAAAVPLEDAKSQFYENAGTSIDDFNSQSLANSLSGSSELLEKSAAAALIRAEDITLDLTLQVAADSALQTLGLNTHGLSPANPEPPEHRGFFELETTPREDLGGSSFDTAVPTTRCACQCGDSAGRRDDGPCPSPNGPCCAHGPCCSPGGLHKFHDEMSGPMSTAGYDFDSQNLASNPELFGGTTTANSDLAVNEKDISSQSLDYPSAERMPLVGICGSQDSHSQCGPGATFEPSDAATRLLGQSDSLPRPPEQGNTEELSQSEALTVDWSTHNATLNFHGLLPELAATGEYLGHYQSEGYLGHMPTTPAITPRDYASPSLAKQFRRNFEKFEASFSHFEEDAPSFCGSCASSGNDLSESESGIGNDPVGTPISSQAHAFTTTVNEPTAPSSHNEPAQLGTFGDDFRAVVDNSVPDAFDAIAEDFNSLDLAKSASVSPHANSGNELSESGTKAALFGTPLSRQTCTTTTACTLGDDFRADVDSSAPDAFDAPAEDFNSHYLAKSASSLSNVISGNDLIESGTSATSFGAPISSPTGTMNVGGAESSYKAHRSLDKWESKITTSAARRSLEKCEAKIPTSACSPLHSQNNAETDEDADVSPPKPQDLVNALDHIVKFVPGLAPLRDATAAAVAQSRLEEFLNAGGQEAIRSAFRIAAPFAASKTMPSSSKSRRRRRRQQ